LLYVGRDAHHTVPAALDQHEPAQVALRQAARIHVVHGQRKRREVEAPLVGPSQENDRILPFVKPGIAYDPLRLTMVGPTDLLDNELLRGWTSGLRVATCAPSAPNLARTSGLRVATCAPSAPNLAWTSGLRVATCAPSAPNPRAPHKQLRHRHLCARHD